MILLRFLLLLAIAGFLIVFTLSNWAVPMQLVFLGIRSPAVPLSIWVLGAIAAGIITTLVITALFGLTGFTARRSIRRTTRAERSAGYSYTEPSRPTATPRAKSDWEEDASDWFDDSGDDWTSPPRDQPRRTDFEAPQTPQSGSRSGSTYSYRYRESDPPEPKRTDVVDADYRVIVPPSRNLDDSEP